MNHKYKAVFLDRDGVINEDFGYVGKIKNFKFLPRVFEALLKLQSAGYKLIIITSQSGIGRGYYSEEDFYNINSFMINKLADKGIVIEKVYFCPHHPKEGKEKYKIICECRKPSPKMVFDAADEFNIDIEKSWNIGNSLRDIQMGENAGCKNILVNSDIEIPLINKFNNLAEAADYIIKNG